jgi:hypothetical protein
MLTFCFFLTMMSLPYPVVEVRVKDHWDMDVAMPYLIELMGNPDLRIGMCKGD